MIVAVANQKGGVGKTTIATNLAVMLSQNNKVMLIDHDVSHSSMNFHFRRSALENVNHFKISLPSTLNEILKLLKKDTFDIILVDLGGFADDMARAVLIYADLILLPTSLSTQDMDGNIHFMKRLNVLKKNGASAKVACVVNNINPKIKEARVNSELAYIRNEGYEIAVTIPSYVGFDVSHALGKSIVEHAPHSKAALAFKKLVEFISKERKNG